MKQLITYISMITVLGCMVISSSCGRTSSGGGKESPVDTSGTAIIKFDTLDHNFGAVRTGEKIGCIFKFTNAGDADLVVTAASASCGCTVPKFSKKPVAPGQGGTIEVIFDTSGREGVQTKTVVVQSNAENNLVILRIMADVINTGTNK